MKKNQQHVARLPSAWKPRHRDDLRRLGSKHDGGYIVTDNIISNTDLIVGLGVGTSWDFERDFHKLTGCPVHCYDHTVSFPLFLRSALPNFLSITHLRRKETIRNILFSLRFKYFFSGKNRHFREKVADDSKIGTDFATIFSRLPDSGNVFIKMDIEGWEYAVLNGLRPFYDRISGLVVELHHLDKLKHVADVQINALRKYFYIVHVHVNNHSALDDNGRPQVVELTFENKQLSGNNEQESRYEYPIDGLDSRNMAYLADYKLEFTD
jgi:hypothetical protein